MKPIPSSLCDLDAQHVWHPFTQAALADSPFAVVRGQGPYLFTEDGRQFLDGISSWWVNLHGHAHPALAQALYRQAQVLEHVIFAGFTHEPAVQLASRLAKVLPSGLTRIFYSDNGSTAVEVGIKMALQFWHNQGIPRTRVLALEGAYHGDTFGAMAASERGSFNAPFAPYLFPVDFIPAPLPGQEATALRALERALEGGDVAVFLYEPLIQGSGGMRMHAPEALANMIRLVRSAGALVFADEVMTGFYRTGRLFASEWVTETSGQQSRSESVASGAFDSPFTSDVQTAPPNAEDLGPDLIALSKGLTGGMMALGVTACRDFVFNAFYSTDRSQTFFHGHSYTANPLACAVALASLDLTLSEKTALAVARISQKQSAFVQRIADHPRVSQARSQGTIWAFEWQSDQESSYFHPVRDQLYRYFLNCGLLLRPLGNTVYTMPPYCFEDDHIETIQDAVLHLLDNTHWLE
ncbi:MAG: aminotransferase class III-fold pyridoxal phosphate-dependent enzyme [Bacteroidetes bacterium]|nr:aminotransferase class III-fold pyridoxal phosphate-dependent enzyme [Bacteroidota bacterium]